MGKIHKILKKKNAAAVGVGAMIVFIAMVLVAGIAAAVLVQTANRLEIQAMQTGEQTKQEVATGIGIINIEGHKNGSTGLDLMVIAIATRAGSGDIDLSQTFMEVSDTSRKNVLKYCASEFWNRSDTNGDLFQVSFFDKLDGCDFGVIVLEDADGSCTYTTPVINRGDKVMLLLNCSLGSAFNRNIPERTDIWGKIQPEDGAAGVFSFTTPAAYTKTVFALY